MANYLDFFQEQDNLNQQGRLLGYVFICNPTFLFIHKFKKALVSSHSWDSEKKNDLKDRKGQLTTKVRKDVMCLRKR
jgi:hypothetical protein